MTSVLFKFKELGFYVMKGKKNVEERSVVERK